LSRATRRNKLHVRVEDPQLVQKRERLIRLTPSHSAFRLFEIARTRLPPRDGPLRGRKPLGGDDVPKRLSRQPDYLVARQTSHSGQLATFISIRPFLR
jgi:hypothetical protein